MSASGNSISNRNKTTDSYYKRHQRRASLLVHPFGVELLKAYKDQRKQPRKEDDGLVDKLVTVLSTKSKKSEKMLWNASEVEISESIRTALNEHWKPPSCKRTVKGENDEKVEGELSQQPTSGNPDIVVRIEPLGSLFKKLDAENSQKDQEERNATAVAKSLPSTSNEEEGEKEEDRVDKETLPVALVVEVSVDTNGTEKKAGQAHEYAGFMEGCDDAALLLTLHFDRKPDRKRNAIELGAYIFRAHSTEKERKHGLLWREYYEAEDGKNDSGSIEEVLKKGC